MARVTLKTDRLSRLMQSQDGTLEWVAESEDRLAFVVSRPIKSCDKQHDIDITTGVVPFIWARFPRHEHVYHGPDRQSRGTVYLNLLEPDSDTAAVIPEDTSDLFTVDLRMTSGMEERYTLPNGQVNTYACRSFELPSDQPYHIVSYEALLESFETTADVVHHMVMYSCDEDAATPEPQECGSMASMCTMMEIAWAVGMPPQYLPTEAGIPLKKYVLLEMHYENLAEEENVRDGSGIRLTFTPQLRKYDFGYLIVGTDLGKTPALEPDRRELVRSGYCPADCLAKHLPDSGVQVHGQFFHSHLLGRSLYTQLLRDGEEMPRLGEMSYYDFNFQHFKHYGKSEPRLMPGDTLVTTCRYNTTGMKSKTAFGLETADEMCFNVVGIYPAIRLQFCWNSTDTGGYCMGESGYSDGGNIDSSLPSVIPYIDPEESRCAAVGTMNVSSGASTVKVLGLSIGTFVALLTGATLLYFSLLFDDKRFCAICADRRNLVSCYILIEHMLRILEVNWNLHCDVGMEGKVDVVLF